MPLLAAISAVTTFASLIFTPPSEVVLMSAVSPVAIDRGVPASIAKSAADLVSV